MTRTLSTFLLLGAVASVTMVHSGKSFGKIQYAAVCGESHGLVAGWDGPRRDTYDEAKRDAAAHLSQFGKGHEASVLEF